jgi:putrescine transport system substrate-binding protein
MSRFAVSLIFLSFAALLASARVDAEERVVHVFNWGDYIDPGVLEDFTKQTGIKVVYDTYNSDAALETQLMLGKGGYDVVVPSGPVLQQAIFAGLLQQLDMTRLPNAKNLSPEIMALLAADDPGNRYAVNYAWFTAGIAFDTDKARERLDGTLPDSWDVIFKPEILKKFADCGVEVLDDPRDLFGLALISMKLDPNTRKLSELRHAAALLGELQRNVKKFHSSEYINALANGDICLAVGWSGDAALAASRASETDNGITVGYAIPKEGSVIALDNLAIPAGAPHVAEAYEFIDFLLRPEIAARNVAATGFASGVAGAEALVAPAVAKAAYPDAETITRLRAVRDYDPGLQRFIERAWAQIKAGK